MRFTLRQLEIFAAVVRAGQVRRAAENLHLSQAAVSQALRELAGALDVTLFERQGREIVPTATARQLLDLTAGPVAELASIAEHLGDASADAPLVGQLRIAASSTVARYVLPSGLARLRQTHPELEITLVSGNSAAIERRIADLDADVGFVEGPVQRTDVRIATWRTDTLQIIAPAGYPRERIGLDALDAHPWVAREPGSGTRSVFEQTLALNGYAPPRAQLVLDDTGAIVRAVAAGAGLACVSRLAAAEAEAERRVEFVDLAGLALERPLWRVYRARAPDSSLIARFLAALETE